jgi:hypothetical protein
MAVTSKAYGNYLLKALNKEVSWSADTIRVMLCTSTYVPNQDTHMYKSSITNEVVGTGYTAGGAALANKTITYNGTTNTITMDADDVTWASSTITARYAVIYADTGVAGTSVVLAYSDFGADMVSSAGNFTITWDPAGILAVTTA